MQCNAMKKPMNLWSVTCDPMTVISSSGYTFIEYWITFTFSAMFCRFVVRRLHMIRGFAVV